MDITITFTGNSICNCRISTGEESDDTGFKGPGEPGANESGPRSGLRGSITHTKDGGYTGLSREKALKQLEDYKEKASKGETVITPLTDGVGKTALKDAFTYMLSRGKADSTRSPPAVQIISTDKITFGAIYVEEENVIYIESAFLTQVLKARNPQLALLALSRVFVHELNNQSHLRNRLVEYRFVIGKLLTQPQFLRTVARL